MISNDLISGKKFQAVKIEFKPQMELPFDLLVFLA